MPLIEFNQGEIICNEGDSLDNLLFITKGSVKADFGGRQLNMEQGDTIGLTAIDSKLHNCKYTATSDVTIFTYPYSDFKSLENLVRDKADIANLLVSSMCRQVVFFLDYKTLLQNEADIAYDTANEVYPEYERLCKVYAFTSKMLAGITDFTRASESDTLKACVQNYYKEIRDSSSNVVKAFFGKPGIAAGFVYKCAEDIGKIIDSCETYKNHLSEISPMFIDEGGHDLFSLVTELHNNSINMRGADEAVEVLIKRLLRLFSVMTRVDPGLYKERLAAYRDELSDLRENQDLVDVPAAEGGVKQNLADSLYVILEYAGISEELRNKYARSIQEYTKNKDRGGTGDEAYRSRKELTVIFYEIYKLVLVKSLKDASPPTIIKMFLKFGYIDAELAGYENANYMYSIADSYKGDPQRGIYTAYEWLLAVYKGEKDPCKDDFDTDYNAHIRELRQAKKINEEEEARMLVDRDAKLMFEMENVFPTVNKITFGRITTYCPFFGEHNVQRRPQDSLLTPDLISDTLKDIVNIDFSAYARQTSFSKPEIGVQRETLNVSVLPDIILMPNMGTRVVMWQEIEGRIRTTPARMFLPIFLLSDIKTMFINLTGEFRWEMCKRIQGPRWSDVTEPSLTSEYFDYLQFYRSNRDLSTDVKSAIKTELTRAKNAYKSVFVSNYSEWLNYESNGSPRLNKFARALMLKYCPFSAEIRQKLTINPQYADLVGRYELRIKQRANHLGKIVQKIKKVTPEIPIEIKNEIEFLKN